MKFAAKQWWLLKPLWAAWLKHCRSREQSLGAEEVRTGCEALLLLTLVSFLGRTRALLVAMSKFPLPGLGSSCARASRTRFGSEPSKLQNHFKVTTGAHFSHLALGGRGLSMHSFPELDCLVLWLQRSSLISFAGGNLSEGTCCCRVSQLLCFTPFITLLFSRSLSESVCVRGRLHCPLQSLKG